MGGSNGGHTVRSALIAGLMLFGCGEAPAPADQASSAISGPMRKGIHRTAGSPVAMARPTATARAGADPALIVPATNGIGYHGGPVMPGTINAYYIWYGDWNVSDQDVLIDLMKNIGGSRYYAINTTYFHYRQLFPGPRPGRRRCSKGGLQRVDQQGASHRRQ
jgi:hypothetical protein